MDVLKSRKFLVCVLVMVSCSVLLGLNKIPITDYMDLMKWVLGGYIGANVFQKVLEK